MARLIIRLHGNQIANVDLQDGVEYIAGRADDAQIVLPAEKGISRHHLKIVMHNGVWTVQLLARFGSLKRGGEESTTLELKEDCGFSAPPFEFTFMLHDPQPAHADSPSDALAESAVSEVVPNQDPRTRLPTARTVATGSTPPASLSAPTEDGLAGNNEATVAGDSNTLVPYVRVINKATGTEEVLKLEGHHWVAGRESACEIPLDEARASRRHFEISRTNEGFFLTDLGSANGTYLNEEALVPNEPWQLASGDVIRAAGAKIIFEIRDTGFNNNFPALVSPQSPAFNPAFTAAPTVQGQLPMPMPYYGPEAGPSNEEVAVIKLEGGRKSGRLSIQGLKQNRVRIAITLLVPTILIGILRDDKMSDPKPSKTQDQSSTSVAFDQLTLEKQQAVKNSFNLAHAMYQQGRYELCIAELKKLHEVVPAYENSRELINFCENGNALTKKKEDQDRLLREQQENERVILQIVQDCANQIRPSTTLDDVRVCLAPAIERAPEHPAVLQLLQTVQIREDEAVRKRDAALAARQRRAAGLKIFERARELYKSGELSRAMQEYERFIEGKYPNLDNERSDARRELAQVRKEIGGKVASLVRSCRENFDKSQFKAAYTACEKALKEDPNNNDAKVLRTRVISEMRRELKSMYEDSVLEESMGNIDTAKERWKQILDKAIPGDEYHMKARRNLQKYGISP